MKHEVKAFSDAYSRMLMIVCLFLSALLNTPASASEVCDSLWRARNAIFAENGHCFETPKAQAIFGKACFPPFGQLNAADRDAVQTIRNLEAARGCRTSPSQVATNSLGAALPKYTVEITLSPKADERLRTSGETIRVWALYYGEAAAGVKGDEMGEVQLTSETVDIKPGEAAHLGGMRVANEDLKKIVGQRPMLLINVYTSRKVFSDNILDCGIYQDEAAKAGNVALSCKLIGE
ncbi:YARHG domain-containing protein [Filomicrobium insigne]|uniref:YARHG domain-containing protein n=1 Tax=Filomicrobium insigne TaxID=418854 RepID=A0A1H0JNC2_9HYPH|nr:YARHG domain-containing protein [Filomicrobium insigne]SDO45277.1 YARHG domain-containing protein [Filomicrobium insigne]